MKKAARWSLSAVALLAAPWACSDFEERQIVVDLRVLAVATGRGAEEAGL